MLNLEMFRESDVIKMATKTHSSIRAGGQLKQDGQADWLKDGESMPEEQREPTVRILVPVKGTPECETSIPLAQRLASAFDAEIYLVRVVVWIDAFSGLRFNPDILRMVDDAARYLNELESRFELPSDRTQRLVACGANAAKEISAIAGSAGVDLIIMASRRKGWLQRLAQGSVSSDVVRSRVCPVLCVPMAGFEASRQHRAMAVTRP